MTHDPQVLALVKAFGYHEETRDSVRAGRMPFVTIARQPGSGGYRLAEELVQRLDKEGAEIPALRGWKWYDKELCEIVAANPNLKVSLRDLVEERHHSGIEAYLAELLSGISNPDAVARATFNTMLQLASVGKCVLIGRGGACLTRELPRGVRPRLIAGKESRIKGLMRHYDLDERAAARRMNEIDDNRFAFHKKYFHADPNDPLLYDAVINTDTVSTEAIVDFVVGRIKIVVLVDEG